MIVPPAPAERVAIAMTTFNRKPLTISCLREVRRQASEGNFHLRVFVADDCSTDGTPQVLAQEFGDLVEVIAGPGNWFWARGTHEAMSAAMNWDADRVILLNDDVLLDPDALARAQEMWESLPHCILVGAVREQTESSITSYGGVRQQSSRPGHLSMVEPHSSSPSRVDTFHGNFVVVPRSALNRVGLVDGGFEHAYGDIDFGLRATAAGIPTVLMPGYVGVCPSNSAAGTWIDPTLPRRERLGLLFGRKGYPLRSHVRFMRKHGGSLWPAYVSASYGRAVIRILKRR